MLNRPTDRMIMITANGLNKELKQAIEDGDIGGKNEIVVATKTANYTVTSDDEVVLMNASAGNRVVTLPSAVGFKKRLVIKKTDSSVNTVSIAPVLSQTIDGGSNYILENQYESITLVSDDATWSII